jgi:hypothetical protein
MARRPQLFTYKHWHWDSEVLDRDFDAANDNDDYNVKSLVERDEELNLQ